MAPRRLPATGGAFSANLCSGFLPSSSAFRGLRHDRRVDTHRFEHGGSSCPRCHRDNRVVIAWPFWYIRRWRARERRPEIALEVLNQRFALGEIGRSEYLQNRDDILAAQVRCRAHRQAAGHRARREPLARCSPTERRFVGCPDLWHSGRFLDPRPLRSRRGPSMKRTPCSPSATPTGRRSVTSISSGSWEMHSREMAHPRRGFSPTMHL